MILFPAIDIYEGKAVRLYGGDYSKVTVYGEPAEIARRFEDAGAEWVHIVDLNGAESSGTNFDKISQIASGTRLKIQTGGGVRSAQRAKELLDSGATRVVFGTVCVTEPETVEEALASYGTEAVVCGLDARDGLVAVRGWKERSALTPEELGKRLTRAGVRYFLYTDVSRDGKLTGVDIDGTAALSKALGADVIASGGVKDLSDLERLKERGVYGAILGKAYYENKIDLKEALRICTI